MAFLGTFTNRIGEVATLTDNTTAESRKSTATYTPAADNLQIATFILTGTITTDPVVTGCGLTWVLIRREQQSANSSRCLVTFRAMGTGSSGAITITLPDVRRASARRFYVKKTDASANVATVTSSALIDGAATFLLNVQYESVTVVSDGATWWIL